MVGKQEGAGHSPHHLQPCPEHDQGCHSGESAVEFIFYSESLIICILLWSQFGAAVKGEWYLMP